MKRYFLERRARSVSLPNTNLELFGGGRDRNGNSVVKLKFYSDQRGFSLHLGRSMSNTKQLLRYNKVDELERNDLLNIEREVVGYIRMYGSPKQKRSLVVHKGFLSERRGRVGKYNNKRGYRIGKANQRFLAESGEPCGLIDDYRSDDMPEWVMTPTGRLYLEDVIQFLDTWCVSGIAIYEEYSKYEAPWHRNLRKTELMMGEHKIHLIKYGKFFKFGIEY